MTSTAVLLPMTPSDCTWRAATCSALSTSSQPACTMWRADSISARDIAPLSMPCSFHM